MEPRRMWSLFEPVHAVVYFAPLSAVPFEAAGLRGFWRRYFAGRCAPLGAVGPAPVVAAFFGFAPAMVERALPDVWTRISPADALTARAAGAGAALAELLPDVTVAAELLGAAAQAADTSGRMLAAANAGLPWPADPVGRLWQAATILREHRGDGHVAALLAAGVTGAESVAWRSALEGESMAAVTQPARGWTDDEWSAAQDSLRSRGWLAPDGAATPAGRAAYAQVEARTDALAAGPWQTLGERATARCVAELEPLVERLWPVLPDDNPIPLRRPRTPSSES